MKNLVQELLREQPTDWLSILEQDFKISVVRDGTLASLKYNQIESPMAHPLVQQCRGMVIDVPAARVVAWPYNKFWNHGETLAASIDWANASVMEKLDGSLMNLYWHEGAWQVASSGTPRAGGTFGSDARTFREAFWQTWSGLGMALPPSRYQGATLMFEFCAHANRVVVKHDKPRIVLHGARGTDGAEMHIGGDLSELCDAHNWERVRLFSVATAADCLAAAEQLNPLEQEGFVVVDHRFHRVKIKSPRYVLLHHLKGEATPRRAIELWQTGETSELLTHFPEMASTIEPVQRRLDEIAQQAVKDYAENVPRATRKEFALAIKDRPWSAVLFRMLSEGSSLDATKEIMRKLPLAVLERMVTSH